MDRLQLWRVGRCTCIAVIFVCGCISFALFAAVHGSTRETYAVTVRRSAANRSSVPVWKSESDANTIAERTCVRQEAWLEKARSGFTAVTHTSNDKCQKVPKVCLKGNSLVHMVRTSTVPKGRISLDFPREDFPWFETDRVMWNVPGWYDGGGGWVQTPFVPLSVRWVTGTDEDDDLRGATFIDDVIPFVIFSDWATNMGETFARMLSHWIQFADASSLVHGHPLIVPMPYQFDLPNFWHLWEPLVPSIEEFAVLSSPCARRQPLCFRQLVGCRLRVSFSGSNLKLRRDWPMARSMVVRQWCPAHIATARIKQKPFVITFAKRNGYRLLKNLPEILQACKGAVLNGRELRCEERVIVSSIRDICWLQDVDVFVTVHGAQLTNGYYMRPGTSMIEVKTSFNTDVNSFWNLNWKLATLSNSTFYWIYSAEGVRSRAPTDWARDRDVLLDWDILKCFFTSILKVDGDISRYEALGCYWDTCCSTK